MASFSALGIGTLTLDVTSDESISNCASQVTKFSGTLNFLVNNAGAQYNMPISDFSIPEAKKIFDLNVWSCISIIQAFLPLLMKADTRMVVHHTSVGSIAGLPFQATYNASKAAFAMFSDILRLELQPFNIKVIVLKTGEVKSNILANLVHSDLPPNSIYSSAPEEDANKMLSGEKLKSLKGTFVDADVWAAEVVGDLTKSNPPLQVWPGGSAWMSRIAVLLPAGMIDGELKKVTGLDVVIFKIKSEK